MEKRRAFAFVNFSSVEQAQQAIIGMHGKLLSGRYVSVYMVKSKFMGSHRAVVQCHNIDGYNHLFHGLSSDVHGFLKNKLMSLPLYINFEYTLDTTFPPLQHTSFPHDTRVLQIDSNIPSTFIHDSPITHDPLIHKVTVSIETLPEKPTSNQCVEVCRHEFCNQASENIQEANVTKKKDKEKTKASYMLASNLIILDPTLLPFQKEKQNAKKNKQARGVVGEGLSLNDFVNDEFSEEEEIDDECENVKNIGKSLGIYIGENQKDFQNNITFDEFLQDLALHGKGT
ncbi:organelle RRM domain-containing protein 6, chloroplastic-like protein isoform X1 [Tanacetum coccineum]|uniref:Organelle RRM domain-containing protein 6, chloroplastic-like protein isoform X1 n=1 Tax=Tanacetum coccineum TaxID=301880 RepID=A0ABQ5ACS4_9ASTR